MPRLTGGRVPFPVSRRVAFDYLVDPRNRPAWQSSLARVSEVDGEPGEGQAWVDETKPGLHARMLTTHFVRPRRWSESGTWRFVRADLTLDFEEPLDFEPADGNGCVVDYEFRIHALGPLGLAASVVSRPAVAADLRRAARILAAPRAG